MKQPIATGLAASLMAFGSPLFAQDAPAAKAAPCDYEIVVLGAGQDAGAPQIGNAEDDGPRLLPSAIALIDRVAGTRYLFDATPAITEQLAMLDAIEPPSEGLGVDGIFLTHAHIGHYLGLAYFGREAAGASGIPVYAMPRMAEFLRTNGPWSQLVALGNIDLVEFGVELGVELGVEGGAESNGGAAAEALLIPPGLAVTALKVPHRDEYSETVGFLVTLGSETILYLPDIDSWDEWASPDGAMLDTILAVADRLFVDATFWDNNELPGRDMREIPHPRVTQTMDLLQHLPAEQRAKIHFLHYNHTNPIRDPNSPESTEVDARGFNVARRGDRYCI